MCRAAFSNAAGRVKCWRSQRWPIGPARAWPQSTSKPRAARPKRPPLVSIEAMKMESQIRAERDCIVRLTHVKPGDTVAAHHLLLEFQ